MNQVSIRELARRLSLSERAVRKGVQAGRLPNSVGRDGEGRPVVLDADAAVQEWHQNAPARSVMRTQAESARAPEPESAPESAPRLDDLRVHRDGDRVVLACNLGARPASEDPADWLALSLTPRLAATVGLALWTAAGGDLEQLPGLKRTHDTQLLAAALRRAAARLEAGA
jgi:hypothetical protein